MKSCNPKKRERGDWFDVFFVRLRDGFRDHLRYFSDKPDATIVFLWALLNRDHETGNFVADRRAIMLDTGLSDRRVKAAFAWLRHGRRCPCSRCVDLPDDFTTRPSYFAEVRPAFRASPPVLRIRRDDSEFLAASAAARGRVKDRQTELNLSPPAGDNAGTSAKGVTKGDTKGSRLATPSRRNSLSPVQSVALDLRSKIEERSRDERGRG